MLNRLRNIWLWSKTLNVPAVLLIVLVLMLSSCVRNTVVSEYCLIAEPIFFAEDIDSEGTIQQILRENAKYDELC
tara:strand:- start:14913 stop:15137 length:225 start_codon:yes stop_codon:yes gene_type:complete